MFAHLDHVKAYPILIWILSFPASMTTFQVHFLTSARTFQLQRNFPTAGNISNCKRNFPTSLGSFKLCSGFSNFARLFRTFSFFPTAISNFMYPKIRCQDFKLKWTIRNKKVNGLKSKTGHFLENK